ncbi:ribose 5-phosphate isomerase B [Elusimicrobium simillimum]|uniref:ribose 5-phosphate isomerase B n=1 Tax=Elusimicrobium simillimum TaxID=3143438 RepID=UPI003C7001DF
MIIAIGTDHAGFPLKETVAAKIKSLGHEVLDFGTFNCDSVDFPDFSAKVAEAVLEGKAWRGILLCGSGVGVNIVANKYKGIKASVCHDTYSAAQGVQHEDMNILCLGARIIGPSLAEALTEAFLTAKYEAKERQVRRVNKIEEIESKNFK